MLKSKKDKIMVIIFQKRMDVKKNKKKENKKNERSRRKHVSIRIGTDVGNDRVAYGRIFGVSK